MCFAYRCRTYRGGLCPNFPMIYMLFCTVFNRDNGERNRIMKEVFQEYGGVIITIVAIMSLIAITSVVIGDEQGGVIKEAFTNIVTQFLQKANAGVK